MGKPPTKTSNADRLREQREARYGHLQATAEPPKPAPPPKPPKRPAPKRKAR